VGRRLPGYPLGSDTSCTPARVLWRWDNVMASSALRMRREITLHAGGRSKRNSSAFLNEAPSPDQSGVRAQLQAHEGGMGATSLSRAKLSNWPSAGAGWDGRLQAGAQTGPCGNAGERPWIGGGTFPRADRGRLAKGMVASISAKKSSIVSSIIVRPRRMVASCCRATNEDEGAAAPRRLPAQCVSATLSKKRQCL